MCLSLWGENNLPGLDHAPLVALDVVGEHGEDGEHAQALDGHLLPHVVLGARGPGQEGAHVLAQLGEGGGGAVIVLDDLVVEGRTHANSAARVVGVEVLTIPELDARGGVAVAVEKVVDVVLITMSGKQKS